MKKSKNMIELIWQQYSLLLNDLLHDRSWWGFWSDYIEHKIRIMKSKEKRVLKLRNNLVWILSNQKDLISIPWINCLRHSWPLKHPSISIPPLILKGPLEDIIVHKCYRYVNTCICTTYRNRGCWVAFFSRSGLLFYVVPS